MGRRTKDENTEAAPGEVAEEVAEDAPPAPEPRLTIEALAAAKGMVETYVASDDGPKVINPGLLAFRAAKAFWRWPNGQEMTEAEFDAAIEKASAQTYR